MADVAVIYSRRSDPNSRENDPAFQDQEAACLKYCDEHGYAVLATRREAYTGTDLEHQEKLQDCIDDVKHGRASVVVSWSYDRLSREANMQTVALYDIEQRYGGRFEAVTEQIDRSDPLREAFRNMLGAVSQIDRKRLVEKLHRGKLGRSTRGALWGTCNAKFGYKWADDFKSTRLNPGHTTFAVDEPNAVTVRKIFEWADQGKAIRWIARQLAAEHATTPSQAAQAQGHGRTVSDSWRHVTVLRILSDPAYCGRFEVNKRKFTHEHKKNKQTGVMEKKLVVTERDQGERIPVPCPAIVPVEQWERVQAVLANNKKEGRPPVDPEEAVMRGHVFCRCGRRMTLTHPKSAGAYVYVCPARKSTALSDQLACPYGETSIRAHIVNAAGMEIAATLVMFREKLQKLYEERHAGQENEPLHRMVEGLTGLIDRKMKARDNYLAAIGDVSDAESRKALLEKAESASREIKEATGQLNAARTKLDIQEQHKATFLSTLSRLSLFPLDKMDEMTAEDKRFLLDLGGVKVTVEGPGEPVEVDTTDGWEKPVTMYRHSDGSLNLFERLRTAFNLRADSESGSILL